MKIALDIGHAKGTGARAHGQEEHDLAERITHYLRRELEKKGHAVTVFDYPEMRNADDLATTIKAVNAESFDFGLSLHLDASDNAEAKGAHVCYLSEKGKKLAEAIAEPLCKVMPGRASKTVKRTNLAILKQTKPVWVLVECGFITHAGDCFILSTRPELIAKIIARGIEVYAYN